MMKNKNKKKLELVKITIAELDRGKKYFIRGGGTVNGCDGTDTDDKDDDGDANKPKDPCWLWSYL